MTDEPVPLESRTPVRLWFPWDMATISVLLGFPGAFGLAARNAWRLGRRGLAYLLLLAGAVILLLFFFALPDGVPQVAVIGLNLAVVGGLYAIMRAQIRAAERTDRAVERAPGLAGLATYLGGWVATAAPTFVLLVALSFLGSQAQAILAGTMTFGTAGVGCEVEGQATSLARDEPLRYVANLSRQVNAGETIHMSIRRVNDAELHAEDLTVDDAADCVGGTVPPSSLSSGRYAFEFTVGVERLAFGEVIVTAP